MTTWKTIKNFLDEHEPTAFAARCDVGDATLSGGESALAVIVAALLEEWDRLDGTQQRAVTDALAASTEQTEKAEAAVRRRVEK